MNHIQNLLRVTIIATLAIIAFGPPTQTQAAPSTAEPDQFSCANVTEIPQIECEALVALYNGTDGPNWTNQRGWLVTNTPCGWYGVTCEGGRVTKLDFNPTYEDKGNKLSGSIPAAIGDLTGLTHLDLSYNQLIALPNTIGNLSNLTALNLFSNQLLRLPITIGNLNNLVGLNLSNNFLIFLPTTLGNLKNLTTLLLKNNHLSSLPTEIGNLKGVTALNISSNQLGSLPATIGNLDNLTLLDLRENLLSTLPATIGNLSKLTNLYLNNNQLNNLPTEIGNLHNLTTFWLYSNQLSTLPDEIGQLNALAALDLASNQLSKLPATIDNLGNLTVLILSSNQLNSLPPDIDKLKSLTWLVLNNNELSNLPDKIGNLNSLTLLDLAANQLNSLPDEIGSLNRLTKLDLSANQLSSLPITMGNLKNLTELYIDSNQLIRLPTTLSNLNNLVKLSLAYNRLIIPSRALYSFITEHHADWATTQTIAPTNIKATALGNDSIELTWTPIPFRSKGGYYEISITDGISFTVHGRTVSKDDNRYVIDGLTQAIAYDIRIRTYTKSHNDDPENSWDDQQNKLWSLSSPIISATTAGADEYESDNQCSEAASIDIGGLPRRHNFYTTGDSDWSTFTAPAAGTYRIEVTVPDGSQADIDLYYYTGCDSLPGDKFVEVFAPGARLDVKAESAGQDFYIKIENLDALAFGPDVAYTLAVRQMQIQPDIPTPGLVPGPAIVVAGRYRGADSAQTNIDQVALDAYQLFRNKGRNDSEIYFLATDSSLPNYDDSATQRNLKNAITIWAKEILTKNDVSKVLTLYLVDHGDENKLYLDKVKEEVLTPEDLDEWLLELENAIPDLKVNVIIEACHAGSFITRRDGSISKEGRVIITSSNEDYDAYVSRHGAAFSDDFITFLQQEYNLGYSFELSSKMVQLFHSTQVPWIDADGDRIPNETEDIAIASLRGFAEPSTLGDDWPPYISAVSMAGKAIRLQAEVRHKGGNHDIEAVWGVVYPPNYVPPTGEAAYEDDGILNEEVLDIIEFEASGTANYVEAAAYSGFSQLGLYRVVVHARDVNGLVAQPVTIEVDTRHRVYLPIISQ